MNPHQIEIDVYSEGGRVCIDGQEVSIARMVLSTFGGVCENGVVNWKNGNRLDNRTTNLRWQHKYIAEAIKWGESRNWVPEDPKLNRLLYLKSVRDFESQMSTGPEKDAPDDVSVFGKPVYLKDLDYVGLKEYLLSGFSKEEQAEIFKS